MNANNLIVYLGQLLNTIGTDEGIARLIRLRENFGPYGFIEVDERLTSSWALIHHDELAVRFAELDESDERLVRQWIDTKLEELRRQQQAARYQERKETRTVSEEPTVDEVLSPAPRFFLTTLFLSPHLPRLEILTVPSAPEREEPDDRAVMEQAVEIIREEESEWDISLRLMGGQYQDDFYFMFFDLLHVACDDETEAFRYDDPNAFWTSRAFDRVWQEPLPVMRSPISGVTLEHLFMTAGSGAAFLAYVPHPDFGQIATYFLVVGGVKIVIGAADGISIGLKSGLSHLILKWMGAPQQIVESEKQRAVAEKQKAVAEKQKAVAEKQKAVAEKQKAVVDKREAAAEKQGATEPETTQVAVEPEKQKAVAEKRKAAAEKQGATEPEKQVAVEPEKQKTTPSKQRLR